MERNVDVTEKETTKIIRDDLNGVDWFICSDGTVFMDHLYNINNWEYDKKIIAQLKGEG